MTAEDYANALYKSFWCFETYTETSPHFAERMGYKNALKHCYSILETDPDREHIDKPFYQHKLAADTDFYENVVAILESKLKNLHL